MVPTVDRFVGRGGSLRERQKQDSHFYRKSDTLPLIFWKNQSGNYKLKYQEQFLTVPLVSYPDLLRTSVSYSLTAESGCEINRLLDRRKQKEN